MFKEYRIIKLLVVTGLLLLFFVNKSSQLKYNKNGFSHNSSYFIGEDVLFSFLGHRTKKSPVKISSLTNDFNEEIVIEPYNSIIEESTLLNGIKTYTTNTYSSKKLKSGIYLINDTIPFVVKDTGSKAEVIVVYPYVNNLINTKFENQSVATERLTYTHLYRSNFVDEISVQMKSFFSQLEQNYSVSYISDIDLETSSSFKHAKVVLFYNNLPYSSKEMKDNLFSYIDHGGNVLLATSYFLNNVIWHDSLDVNQIVLNKKLKDQNISTKERYGVSLWEINRKYIEEYIGLSYGTGGKPSIDNGYAVFDENSMLFKDVQVKSIPVSGDLFMGAHGKYDGDTIIFEKLPVYSIKAHAFSTAGHNGNENGIIGIIEVHKNDTSGILLSLGTGQWFSDWNYGKSSVIQKVTNNAFNYLLGY